MAQLHQFVSWLTGKDSQSDLVGTSARSFRRDTAWCWSLQPRLPVTGEVHDVLLVDGVWIGSWCLLIAQASTGQIVNWQWCARESTAAWEALFEPIPQPVVIVTDGGSGIRSALARTWPDTLIQRCIFHLQLNVTRELTRKPKTYPGRALRQISLNLSTVRTVQDAITWRLTLDAWWHKFGHLTRERTRYANGHTGFTHDRLRKAWGVLQRVAETGHAFTYLAAECPRTTSRLESVNSHIRHLLRNHRGMSIEHRRKAVEWFLLLQEIPLNQAHRHASAPTPPAPEPEHDEPTGPALYDTALNPEEGLWHRQGWIGDH